MRLSIQCKINYMRTADHFVKFSAWNKRFFHSWTRCVCFYLVMNFSHTPNRRSSVYCVALKRVYKKYTSYPRNEDFGEKTIYYKIKIWLSFRIKTRGYLSLFFLFFVILLNSLWMKKSCYFFIMKTFWQKLFPTK